MRSVGDSLANKIDNDTIEWYHYAVGKHDKILAAIFAEPVRAGIQWADIESLFKHHGAILSEGSGSRVRVELNGEVATFHRPHPRPNTDKGALKSVRRFLTQASVTPPQSVEEEKEPDE